jgi:hypothetical protein
MSHMVNGKRQESIGLLFVHGIGEQKRFEHVRQTAAQFAELMRQPESDDGGSGETFGCSVVDNTENWEVPPGEPHPLGLSPIQITLESNERRLIFRCHEAWWADLGARTGLLDIILFWIWAFGQWCAPIYRELDAAGLKKSDRTRSNRSLNKQVSQLVTLPDSIVGRFYREFGARFKLLLAGLATTFVVLSWVIVKRLFAKLLQQAPSPTLLVSYVGDVRTYEERAAPGDTALSDPGYPRRVGIRRRMVTEMVMMGGMAARGEVDRWYVAAHSQGTVVAYNGLTEIGHALPNYLSEAQWLSLPGHFKSDPGCETRGTDEIQAMMPSRPAWLVDSDVINRSALFEQLRGFITYGSPLNKFAAIWPRIVATATDRKDNQNPFHKDCRWLNLRAPQDPVAGDLTSFYGQPPQAVAQERPGFSGCIPPLTSVDTPFGIDVLISHLRYFKGGERFAKGTAMRQRREAMQWVMNGGTAVANTILTTIPKAMKIPGAVTLAYYLAFLFLLLLVAATLITIGGDLVTSLFGEPSNIVTMNLHVFFPLLCANIVALLAFVASIIAATGYFRWFWESRLNIRLADQPELATARFVNTVHLIVSIVSLAAVIAPTVWFEFAPLNWNAGPHLQMVAAWLQSLGGAELILLLSSTLTAIALIGHPLTNKCVFTPLHYTDR